MLSAICQPQPCLREFFEFPLALGIARSLRGSPTRRGFFSAMPADLRHNRGRPPFFLSPKCGGLLFGSQLLSDATRLTVHILCNCGGEHVRTFIDVKSSRAINNKSRARNPEYYLAGRTIDVALVAHSTW
jgi:hypothetical protein